MKVFIDYGIEYVKLDRKDTWNVDHTLAIIILPLLKKMKAEKNGAPYVDDADVPWYYRTNVNKIDEHGLSTSHFKKYDWVLDEIIWTFEQLVNFDWDMRYYGKNKLDPEGYNNHYACIDNGLRLFGRYYQTLWT